MPGVPSASDVTDQASSNAGDAAVGGLGILVGSAVLGGTVGPAVGGTVAGASVGGQSGDMITMIGMLQSAQNLGSGVGGGGGGGGGTRL